MKFSSSTEAWCSWKPRLRRMARYSGTASRSVLIAHPRPRQSQCTQCSEIDLRVDPGGVDSAVAQQLTDLGERGALMEHLRGEGMPKLMCALAPCFEPGAFQGAHDDQADRLLATEAAERCLGAQKQRAARAAWSAVLQVVGNGLAHLCRQRQLTWPIAFATHTEVAVLPVNVLQC